MTRTAPSLAGHHFGEIRANASPVTATTSSGRLRSLWTPRCSRQNGQSYPSGSCVCTCGTLRRARPGERLRTQLLGREPELAAHDVLGLGPGEEAGRAEGADEVPQHGIAQ